MTKQQPNPHTNGPQVLRGMYALAECGVETRLRNWPGNPAQPAVIDMFLDEKHVGSATWTPTPGGGRYAGGSVKDRHSERQLKAETFNDLKFFTLLLTD